MSSGDVQDLVTSSDDLHVAWSGPDRLWWVVGVLGSYGSSRNRDEAIELALDTSTSEYGRKRIIVHTRSRAIQFMIQKSSPRQRRAHS